MRIKIQRSTTQPGLSAFRKENMHSPSHPETEAFLTDILTVLLYPGFWGLEKGRYGSAFRHPSRREVPITSLVQPLQKHDTIRTLRTLEHVLPKLRRRKYSKLIFRTRCA
jgi:hypothetical protein